MHSLPQPNHSLPTSPRGTRKMSSVHQTKPKEEETSKSAEETTIKADLKDDRNSLEKENGDRSLVEEGNGNDEKLMEEENGDGSSLEKENGDGSSVVKENDDGGLMEEENGNGNSVEKKNGDGSLMEEGNGDGNSVEKEDGGEAKADTEEEATRKLLESLTVWNEDLWDWTWSIEEEHMFWGWLCNPLGLDATVITGVYHGGGEEDEEIIGGEDDDALDLNDINDIHTP